MNAIHSLLNDPWAQRALVAGLAVGTLCSLLSVVVVLKRMAFISQGISHAGFGGVGTAVILGLGGLSQDLMILAFCLGTAIIIGILSRRQKVEVDSAIGILLVAAMAWGVVMIQLRGSFQSWAWYVETFGSGGMQNNYDLLLNGTLLNVSYEQARFALLAAAFVLLILAALFKEILFFAFDEKVSHVFGVRTRFIYYLLLVVLSVTVVLSMRVVGFVLVTALLVIPGATALLLSRRLGRVMVISWLVGMTGTIGGLLLSLEVGDIAAGPSIVAVLCVCFFLVFIARGGLNRVRRQPSTPAQTPAAAPGGLERAGAK